MRTVTQLAPSAPASKPPPGRSAPPDAAAGFAAVLDNQKARTAVAEGQTPKRPTGAEDHKATTSPATPDVREQAVDAKQTSTTSDARKDVAEDAATPEPALPVLVDQAPVALTMPAPVAVPSAAIPASSASPAPGLGGPDSPGPVAPPAGLPIADAAPAAPVAGAPLGGRDRLPVPGPTPADAAVPTPADTAKTPASPTGIAVPTAANAAPAAPKADATPDPSAQAPSAQDQPQGDAGKGSAQQDAPRTMAAPVLDALRAAAPAAGHASTIADSSAAVAATATTPAPTTSTTATAAAPATPAGTGSVPLAQAVETVRLTIGASAQRGVTRARIALRPEELGGVEVHLRHTAEGLSARVVAEVPEAAHLLSQAAGELRRTLEQQGVNVVRIDVGTAGDEATGTGAGAAGNEQRGGRRHGGSTAAGDASENDLPTPDRTIELPNGALVDVLA